ncbi:MAG TPA: DMT family transporter [Dongiaceae bacterium]|nr:DMT family transporter [Dongiaceae bacterium]
MNTAPGPRRQDQPLRAIAFLIAAGLGFTLLNATAKHLAQTVPVLQVAWGRYLFHFLVLPLYLGRGAFTSRQAWIPLIRPRALWLQLFRSAMLFGSTGLYFLSVRFITLAEATTIGFIEPLFVTAMSFLFLHEFVGRRRWIAVCIGLCGALIVVSPGLQGVAHGSTGHGWLTLANPWLLLPLLTASFNATYTVMTRVVAAHDQAVTTLAFSGVVGMIGCSLALPWIWQPLTALDWCYLLILGLSGAFSHFMAIKAYGYASGAVLAPFSYVMLIWTVLIDLIWFGNWPRSTTWIGSAVIIATGLYVWHRERVRSHRAA